MITPLLLAGLLCAVVVLLWYLRRWWLLQKTADIPTLPREVPFFGHLLNIFCTSKHITDPVVVKELMNIPMNKMFVYKLAGWLRRGLVTSDVPTWKRHRKILNPSFNQQMLNKFFSIFDKEAKNLVITMEDKVGKGEFDGFEYINKYTLDAVCQTALGLSDDVKTLGMYEEYSIMILKQFHLMTARLQNIWMLIEPLYYWSRTKTEEMWIVKNMITMSSSIIEERKSLLLKATDECFKPFLDVLLEHEEKKTMTLQEIREEVDTIITAGSDTTSKTIIYTLVMVGSFPEVQEKLHDELKEVFKNSDRAMSKDDLPLLVYTEAVIKEVMRLFPVVPVVGREISDKDVQIGKYNFPKGSSLLVDYKAMHMNLSWGDPEDFRPERWLEPQNTKQNAYAPFGIGKRACIGKGYAMILLKTTLVHLMRRYKFHSDHRRLQLQWVVLLDPAAGHEISIEYRK